jgi:hypothetical protein
MKFTLATRAHDAELRRLAREEAMPGWVRLAYTRDPDWFKGQDALGHFHQTVIGLGEDGAVVGAGVRAIRKVFIHGEPTDIGYLCGLRSLPGARRGLGLAQGYRFFKKLHDADRLTPAYLTTILESNEPANALLTSGRAGLPVYHDLGRVNTYLWLQPSRKRFPAPPGVCIRRDAGALGDDLIGFLRKEGAPRPFFPVIDKQTFLSPQWRGFKTEGMAVAYRDGEIIGLAALWDQRAFRQIHISGYAPWLAASRRLVNGLAWLTAGVPALQKPGERLNACFTALVCVKDDDAQVFAALMRCLYDHARMGGIPFFIVSLHERSPLNAAFSRRDKLFNCASRLYCACWEDGEPFFQSFDPALVPHIEGGML